MGPVICPECGKEMITGARRCTSCGYVTKGKKRKLIIITAGAVILAAIIILVTVLITNSGTPLAIGQARFYEEFPGQTLMTIKEQKFDPETCFVWITYKNAYYKGGVDGFCYELKLRDNKWVIAGKITE